MSDLGHFERRMFHRVLLGLHYEPPLIAMRGQPFDDGLEVERAVSRDGEGAPGHRVEERVFGPVESVDHGLAHVLRMDMADPRVMLIDDAKHITAREG